MATSRFLLLLAVALATTDCGSTPKTALQQPGSKPLTLAAPDGSKVNLDTLWRERDATVLVFWSGECPCVRRYQERVDALLTQFPSDRVRVLGVSSNAGEDYSDVLRVARERRIRISILRDEGGEVAKAVGVHTTPTVVVVDRHGSIRFHGWIDNERVAGDPGREPWLEHALQGVLAARNDFAARSPTYGCAITRPLFGRADATCCNRPSGDQEVH